MNGQKVRPDPEGTSKSQRGKGSRCWTVWKNVLVIIMLGGFLIGTQPIKAEATSLSRTSYDDGIPDEIREYCEIVGNEYEICPELLEAIAYHESRFIPTVRNKNRVGLMQVNVRVHADRIEKNDWTADDMTDPYKNLTVAADLLHELYESYGDDDPIILMLYNGDKWKTIEKYKEYGFLTPYVDDILTRRAKYERLHGK